MTLVILRDVLVHDRVPLAADLDRQPDVQSVAGGHRARRHTGVGQRGRGSGIGVHRDARVGGDQVAEPAGVHVVGVRMGDEHRGESGERLPALGEHAGVDQHAAGAVDHVQAGVAVLGDLHRPSLPASTAGGLPRADGGFSG